MQKRFLILQVCLALTLTCFSSYIQAAGLTSLKESKAGYNSRVKAVLDGWAAVNPIPPWPEHGDEKDVAVCLAKLAADTDIAQVNNHLANNSQLGLDSDFYCLWLVRIYYLYENKLKQAAKDNILRVLKESTNIRPNQTRYGSENHWFQEQSNAYLYRQLMGQDTSGFRRYLLKAMHLRVKYDFTEINSPGYQAPVVKAIANLYDFAEDPVVKKAAEVTLDFIWACYAVQSLDRMRGGPYGRSFAVDWRDDDWGHTWDGLYWLSFVWLGNGDQTVSVMGYIVRNSIEPHEMVVVSDYDANMVFAATSGYRIPDVVVDIAVDREGRAPFVYKGYHKGAPPIEGSGEWTTADCYHYYYHTPHYLLASGKVQDYYSMSRWDIVFDTDYLAFIKNMFKLDSVTQYKNVVLCSKTPVEYSSSIDEVVEENKIEFFREGESFGAVRGGVIEMGLASDYSSFASWKAHIKANTSLSGNTYISAKGDVIKFTTGPTIVSVNGKPYTDYTNWKFMDSPYITSELNSAHIKVRKDGRELILDFSEIENPFKSEDNNELEALVSSDITEGDSSPAVTNLLVWPGDLNNDGEVNEIDILPVGLYWLLKGPVRPNASSNWEAQPSPAWDPIRAAYADANGDGVVDEREIIVIGLNWNHDWSQGQGAATLNPGRTPNSNPLDAYQAIYRFIRDIPESEAITRIKTLLSSLITADLKQEKPFLLEK